MQNDLEELERVAFETWYAADMVTFGFSKTTAADIAGLREGDGYGDRPALNHKWEGWKARSATALSLIEEVKRLRGGWQPIGTTAGDLWWNPGNDEAGFTHWADAFEDANEDGEDYSVELHRGRKLSPVWGALIDGHIKIFATEAEADAARASLSPRGEQS
jgi:hypothetical protein